MSFEELLGGILPSSFDMTETAKVRKRLYDDNDVSASVLLEELKTIVHQNMQTVVNWLLLLSLAAPVHAECCVTIQSLDFDVDTKV